MVTIANGMIALLNRKKNTAGTEKPSGTRTRQCKLRF